MGFRRNISTAHPAVEGARRRRRSALLDLLLEGAGIADTFDDEEADAEADYREWAARADELAECAELLHSGGYTDHGSPLPLHHGEQVFLVLNNAEIVSPHDMGVVTLTDRRLVFQSPNQALQVRYSRLVGYEHDETQPITYFKVSDAEQAFGIRYATATAFRFQQRLAVALASSGSDRKARAIALEAELAQHLASRPAALPVRQPA